MKRLLLYLIIFIPFFFYGGSKAYSQPAQFTQDSIPVVDGKIVFAIDFEYNLTKEEFHKRAYAYLDSILDPYAGRYHLNNEDFTVSRITDYLAIDQSFFQVVGMYMTYSLQLEYKDGLCKLLIQDVRFMEKGYFESQEESTRKLDMPEHTAKDIMIDKNYSPLFTKNASDKITEASLKRINEIVKNLDASFAKN